MKYCLACGKDTKQSLDYHTSCLKKLFSVNYMPHIGFTLKEVTIKAQKMAGRLSISGVQPKLSMKLERKTKELIVVAESGEFILKPQVETFNNLPQNENLCMNMAKGFGIDVPPHTLITLADESWAYIVKRFDREKNIKIHVENFSQILQKQDKYKGSLEEIGKKLKETSKFPGLDTQLFFERVLFNFLIGNGDAHMKNFSIIYKPNGAIRLSPAYDILSSKLVIADEEDTALSLNGKRNNLTRKDFMRFAEYLGVPEKVVKARLKIDAKYMTNLINNSLLDQNEKERLKSIINERISRIIRV